MELWREWLTVVRDTAASGENAARRPEELREGHLIRINEDTVVMQRTKMAQGK